MQVHCRYRVFNALNTSVGGDPTVNVRCSEKELGGLDQGASFPLMLDSMEHSEFCLVLAGDSQSTRRLSEIFLAGASCVLLHVCSSAAEPASCSLRQLSPWTAYGTPS